MTESDHIDRILREAGMGTDGSTAVEALSRVYRLLNYIERELSNIYGRYGLNRGEADVLGALARSPQAALLPTQLSNTLMCSSGAMTNRLDRLEESGFIKRTHDREDRRAVRIALTASGKTVIERANAERDAADAKLVPGLKKAERRELVALLRKMLAAYEAAEAAEAPPPPKLGRPRSTRVKRASAAAGSAATNTNFRSHAVEVRDTSDS
jgi:DNA-binding MarR family transcriptional regulator